jgi:hypothetical protein
MRPSRIGLNWMLVFANNTTPLFFVATGWMPAADFAKVRGSFEMRLNEGDIELCLAYQLANVENSCDTPTAVGSYATSAGLLYPGQWDDISSATAQKQLVRFGFLARNVANTQRNYAQVGGWIEYVEK